MAFRWNFHYFTSISSHLLNKFNQPTGLKKKSIQTFDRSFVLHDNIAYNKKQPKLKMMKFGLFILDGYPFCSSQHLLFEMQLKIILEWSRKLKHHMFSVLWLCWTIFSKLHALLMAIITTRSMLFLQMMHDFVDVSLLCQVLLSNQVLSSASHIFRY